MKQDFWANKIFIFHPLLFGKHMRLDWTKIINIKMYILAKPIATWYFCDYWWLYYGIIVKSNLIHDLYSYRVHIYSYTDNWLQPWFWGYFFNKQQLIVWTRIKQNVSLWVWWWPQSEKLVKGLHAILFIFILRYQNYIG